MPVKTGKLVTESRSHSPKLLVHLLGCANETRAVVEGVEMMALVDMGNLMKGVLHFKRMEGIAIP